MKIWVNQITPLAFGIRNQLLHHIKIAVTFGIKGPSRQCPKSNFIFGFGIPEKLRK